MSKLIVCSGQLGPGGAERVLAVLSKPFADHFDSVEYVLWRDNKCFESYFPIDPRVKITGIHSESGSSCIFSHLIWFRKHIKEQRPDVVLSFFEMVNFCVLLSLVMMKVKIVVSERNDPHYTHHGKLFRWLVTQMYGLSKVSKVVVQSIIIKDFFPSKIKNKISIIHNPINMKSDFVGLALRVPKMKRIVSVGRLVPQKHFDMLIEAFSVFKSLHPDYSLHIYGEGMGRAALEELIKRLKLDNAVFLPGNIENVWNEIAVAQMFVLTSKYEGMPNVLLEAMCLGLPCVSTKVSGATDLIVNGKNGFLVDADDNVNLVNAMSSLVDNSELSASIGKSACDVFDNHQVDFISQQWISILD